MKLEATDLQHRWNLSWGAWAEEINKFVLTETWYRAYEKHLKVGEDWNDSFRFPELFGAVQRKFDNLVEFLPEVKIKGDGDDVLAAQAAYDHQVRISNLNREKQRALMDSVKTGMGVIFVAPTRFERNGKLFYDGLGAERVDPRDFIPAYSATVMHDHTGETYCPYVFRRRVYLESTFRSKYTTEKGFKNLDKVVGNNSFQGGFSGDRTLTQREGREKESGNYVTVLEYWDSEYDIFRVFANDFDTIIYDSPDGIPYAHKQLPFHVYYNYRREDSLAGVGEVELRMSYNLFREAILNLLADNAKLELQPAYVIDGDINFNTEEAELAPGAVFTVRGLDGGKLQDSIMPFRAGGMTADIPSIINIIEDSSISSLGDDTRALYANPDQLATQTLAKREALQKRIRANIVRNVVDTEFYLAQQIISYLKYELAKPYKGHSGKVEYREISIQGFEALQDKKETGVEFEKVRGVTSKFYLNDVVAEDFDAFEIEVVPSKLDEELKRDQTEKLILFVQQIMSTAQINPAMLGDFDVAEFLKQVSQNLNLDVSKIYPPANKDAMEIDVINTEHDMISMGVVPPIRQDEDSLEHYEKHVEFEKSSVFKKLSKKAQDAMSKHKILTLKNVQIQKTGATQLGQGGLGGVPQISQPSPVQGMVAAPQGQATPNGAGIPTPPAQGRVPQGQGVGPAQANPAASIGL